VLDLLSCGQRAGHIVELVQNLIRLVEGPPHVVLVDDLPKLGRAELPRPLDVDRPSGLVDAHIPSGVVWEAFLLFGEKVIGTDSVESVYVSVLLVIGEHFNHGFKVELPGPAEPKQEGIVVPGVMVYVVDFNPLLELLEDFLLGL
jgi:hypothetical protein